MLTLDMIYHAAFTLKNTARVTDLIHAPSLGPKGGLYLKTENLQNTGSFKLRGAYYKISQLSEEERKQGVIACSAGNHAQGVALAASRLGIQATICIPNIAPISKIEATKRYGAQVELVRGVYDDAYARAVELQKETGAVFIHPFDDERVIAGQGTIGLEILDQLPDVGAIVVPIGGGGLISGIAYAVKSLKPDIKVYGVQSAGAPSMVTSLAQKARTGLDSVATMADGIAVKMPGELTYSLCSQYVDEVLTVTDEEVSVAILALIEQQKLITEGAGAVAVAAALFGRIPSDGRKTVCVLSGGNIDVTILSRVITRGLLMSGRISHLRIELNDRPGQLEAVCHIIAEAEANIISVNHDRTSGSRVTNCFLDVDIETRDHAQHAEIERRLRDAGMTLLER